MGASVISSAPERPGLLRVGRYTVHGEIGGGGMARVHLGRLEGEGGFARTVAIKRLHPHLLAETHFVNMLLDEARLAARIQHPNVVQTLDVVAADGELFLVLEYIRGESLYLLRKAVLMEGTPIPVPIACAIACGILRGLHAAHGARDAEGRPLGIVHRDVSPQNIIIGADGIPRLLDFGVAKAAVRLQNTADGGLKGKLAYMSPEQVLGHDVSASTDVFALSTVLWECLTGRRLFGGVGDDTKTIARLIECDIHGPRAIVPAVPEALDALVLRGLAREPSERFTSAEEMADAIEAAVPTASTTQLSRWVSSLAVPLLAHRDALVARVEGSSSVEAPPHTERMADRPTHEPTISDSGTRSRADATERDGRIEQRMVHVQEEATRADGRKVVVMVVVTVMTIVGVALLYFGGVLKPATSPDQAQKPPPVPVTETATATAIAIAPVPAVADAGAGAGEGADPTAPATLATVSPPSTKAGTPRRTPPTAPTPTAPSAAGKKAPVDVGF